MTVSRFICARATIRVRQDEIGEGGAFHRTSPDGALGEKADLHSPAQFTHTIMHSSRLAESWRLLRITQYAGNASRRITRDILSPISVVPMSIPLVASPLRTSSS